VSFLLDTHILLWWLNGDEMAEEAYDAIANPDHVIYVSSASIWEIAIKSALGKLEAEVDVIVAAAHEDFQALPVSWEHAAAVSNLPHHHRDPFDRLLLAQAIKDQLTLITRDAAFAAYEAKLLGA